MSSPIRLEFGNREQIADIRRMEKLQDIIEVAKVDPDERTEEQKALLVEHGFKQDVKTEYTVRIEGSFTAYVMVKAKDDREARQIAREEWSARDIDDTEVDNVEIDDRPEDAAKVNEWERELSNLKSKYLGEKSA